MRCNLKNAEILSGNAAIFHLGYHDHLYRPIVIKNSDASILDKLRLRQMEKESDFLSANLKKGMGH